MAKTSLLSKILAARSQQSFPEAWGDLVLRGFVGLTFGLNHGPGKLPPSDKFVAAVASLGFPAPDLFAWLAGCSEFFGGLLLAVGLATRPAAAAVAFTMAVAGFGQHAADPFMKKELAFVYLAIAVHYLLAGAGSYSLDALLSRRKR